MGDSSLSWVPVVGTMINAWSQERNMEENANQARIQREWQEEMWNRNNQYNTPLAQKERLEAAGINPYSVMAQGGANTGVSSSPAQPYQRAEANFHSPMDENAVMNSVAIQAQKQGVELDNDAKRINLQFLYVKNVKELQDMDAEIGLKISEKERNHEDASRLYWEREQVRLTLGSVIKKMEGDARFANIQADYAPSRFELAMALDRVEIRLKQSGLAVNSKTIDKLISDIQTNDKIQGYYKSLQDLNYQQVENLVDDIRNNVRNRVSSRLKDKREQEKLEADITISVIGALMEANSKKFGVAGTFRTTQGKVVQVLKKQYPHLVNSDVLDKIFYNLDEGPQNYQHQNGGVR